MFSAEIQYAVFRYMLNELGDEAANIGLIALSDQAPFVQVRFLPDPTVKSRADARVRLAPARRFIDRALGLVEGPDLEVAIADQSAYLEQLRDLGGNLVRVSPLRTVLTNDVPTEFDLLFEQLVGSGERMELRDIATRDPLGKLRREASTALVKTFREAYGKPLSSPQFEKRYEIKAPRGHTNIIDLAVVTQTKKRRTEVLFQHLLLLPDAEENYTQAAGLCYKWNDIQSANHATRSMTAVLYGRREPERKALADSLKILKKEDVKVVRLAQLPTEVRRLADQKELLLTS